MENPIPTSFFRKRSKDSFEENYDIQRILSGISRQSIPILLIILFLTGWAIWISYGMVSRKKSEAYLVFEPLDSRQLPGGVPFSAPNLGTVLEMIKMPANIMAVRSRLNLEGSISELTSKFEFPYPKANSNIITIASSGNLGQELVNTLAEVAVKTNQSYFHSEFQRTLLALMSQAEYANNLLIKKMNEIEQFKQKENYLDIDERNTLFISQLEAARRRARELDLETSRTGIELQFLKKEAEKYRLSNEGDYSEAALTQIDAIQSALYEAQLKYAPTNPKLLSLERQLRHLKSEGGTEGLSFSNKDTSYTLSRNSKDSLNLRILSTESQLLALQELQKKAHQEEEVMNKRALDLPRLQVEFAKTLQEKKLYQQQIAYINKSIDETRILLATQKGNLSILQLAEKEGTVKRSPWTYVIPFMAATFGLFLGGGLAFLRELFDPHFRTLQELSLRYTIPPILLVPHLKMKSFNAADVMMLPYMRKLYDRLELFLTTNPLENKPFSLSFLSTKEEEGRALLSYYFACYLQTRGKKVLFLSFWPTHLAELLEASKKVPGLKEYIEGTAELDESIDTRGRVDTLVLRERIHTLTEILELEKIRKFFTLLYERYDIIILRPPPLEQGEEGISIRLAALSTLSVFVISSAHGKKEKVDSALQKLEEHQVRVLGLILNDIPKAYFRDQL